MKARFMALQTVLGILALCVITASMSAVMTQDSLVVRLLGFVAGPLGGGLAWFFISARWQTATRSSALSIALTKRRVTRPLVIGTIGAGLLLRIAERNPDAGSAIVRTMDRLAVSHADRIRLEQDNRAAMTGSAISDQGLEVKQGAGSLTPGSLSIAVDEHAFVIRSGEPDAEHAIIDGPDRLLILRTPMPESVRQSLVARSRQGAFPLKDVADLGPLMRECIVEAVHLAKDEVHFILATETMMWRDLRPLIDQQHPDPERESLSSRMLRIAWALSKGTEPPARPSSRSA